VREINNNFHFFDHHDEMMVDRETDFQMMLLEVRGEIKEMKY